MFKKHVPKGKCQRLLLKFIKHKVSYKKNNFAVNNPRTSSFVNKEGLPRYKSLGRANRCVEYIEEYKLEWTTK